MKAFFSFLYSTNIGSYCHTRNSRQLWLKDVTCLGNWLTREFDKVSLSHHYCCHHRHHYRISFLLTCLVFFPVWVKWARRGNFSKQLWFIFFLILVCKCERMNSLPCGSLRNGLFEISSYARAYVPITFESTKVQITFGLSWKKTKCKIIFFFSLYFMKHFHHSSTQIAWHFPLKMFSVHTSWRCIKPFETGYLSLLYRRFWVIQGDSIPSDEVSADEEQVDLKERVSMSEFDALGSFERSLAVTIVFFLMLILRRGLLISAIWTAFGWRSFCFPDNTFPFCFENVVNPGN